MTAKEDKHFWDETRKPWMDLENERRPINPLKSAKSSNRANALTGTANQQMAGFFQDIVAEQAMKDRLAGFARVETPDAPAPKADFDCCQTHAECADNDSCPSDSESLDKYDQDIEAIRARRLAQLRQANSREATLRGLGHGSYGEIVESEFLDTVIKSPRAVVHFYLDDFARCKAVDKNLALVSPSLIGMRIVKINAEKCPFFTEKLSIRVLPTLVYFIDGKAVHTVTGFAEFGGVDDFEISSFIKSLGTHRMLLESDESQYKQWKAVKRIEAECSEDDDDCL